jgi:short-subunit dehydrogenase
MTTETVLITGASAGIGRELARLFAADGCDLVLVARRRELLDKLSEELSQQHGVSVRVLPEDLSDPASPDRIWQQLTTSDGHVDTLVNNAGFGADGMLSELPIERQVDMVQVNVAALTHLTRLFLPAMIQRRRGGILNVGSTAAFQPGPYMAIYYATKAYVLSFTEALVEELRGTGVHATCLAPGVTKTEFFVKAKMERSLLVRLGMMDAAVVARAGYRGYRAGRAIVIPGIKNKLGAFSVRLTPRIVVRKITAALNRLP